MLRRDFINMMAGAGAALWAGQYPLFAEQAEARSPTLYGTQATLDNTPEFARNNIARWAGVDTILATRNDVTFDRRGEPAGFNEGFKRVLKGLRLDPDDFFKIPDIKADRSRKPYEQGVALYTAKGKFGSRGFSRRNFNEQDSTKWDMAFIMGPDINVDPRQVFSTSTTIPLEHLKTGIRGEILANHVLAHEAAHMFLKASGFLLPPEGLYCAPDGSCYNDNGLYDETQGTFVKNGEGFLPKKLGDVYKPDVGSQATQARNSIENQAEYYCDQFAVNQCLTIGMTQQEASDIRNVRAIACMTGTSPVIATQLYIRGKELDVAALRKVVLSVRDPYRAWVSMGNKWGDHVKGVNFTAPPTPARIYRDTNDMLKAGKFSDSALEQEIATLFLQAGSELAPGFFEIGTLVAENRPNQAQTFEI
jgi:hypothetical protein